MIGSLKGKISFKTQKFLILDVVGVGYKVNVLPQTILDIKNNEIFLWIHTHVREDSLDLYGFLDYSELETFEMLINISSIGPRSALTILGAVTIENLKTAIQTSDLKYLTKISGIGRKTAEKIILELRDKFEGQKEGMNASLKTEVDALEALKSLGYSQFEAREVLKDISPETNLNEKIRIALKALGK
jgi:Holliday junction DNA helicase RuvA